jgi:hypothetical protein
VRRPAVIGEGDWIVLVGRGAVCSNALFHGFRSPGHLPGQGRRQGAALRHGELLVFEPDRSANVYVGLSENWVRSVKTLQVGDSGYRIRVCFGKIQIRAWCEQ